MGSHTFSIPASINREVPHGSFPLDAHVLRSSHYPLICRSHSQPPTLKNSASRSFPDYYLILHLTKFTLWRCSFLLRCFLLHFLRRCCCEDTLFYRVQACKPILQFSMLATSKRGVTPPSYARTPHWLPFSLTTFSFLKKFGSLEKV